MQSLPGSVTELQLVADDLRAWHGVVEPLFPDRSAKPRECGLTLVIDKGLGYDSTQQLLELAGNYIDIIKLSFGTSAMYRESFLRRKVALAKQCGVGIMPGGTFAEVAIMQGRLEAFLEYAREIGFTHIEISDGAIDMPPRMRAHAVEMARSMDFTVLTEVGKKHPDDSVPTEVLVDQMIMDVGSGASNVILEARESGRGVTIFDQDGRIREEEMALILDHLDGLVSADRIIWEAPLSSQQKHFILRFGPNVNLGNIAPGDVIALEALRIGFRGDTLRSYYRSNGRVDIGLPTQPLVPGEG